MTGKLLTIAIPTYNRAGHLALLLDTLAIEVRGLEASIDVVVLDNASTDRTPEVTAGFVAQCAVGRVVRQATNIGSAPNFVACYRAADSHYFWMIGDDDVPAKGLLAHVVQLLLSDAPDIVYADSRAAEDVALLVADPSIPTLRTRLVTRDDFCRHTHVHLTFISASIISKSCLETHLDLGHALIEMGPHFVQLAWTLGAVRHGSRFALIEGPGLLATIGNSGGYGPAMVFGVEFPRVVRRALGDSPQARMIVRRTLVCYLPWLFWAVRNDTAGDFDAESPWTTLREQLGRSPWYWAVIVPIARAWWPVALAVRTFARVVSYALRKWDRYVAA